MSGKVVLVTGANSGIGKETARVLLTKNAKVYVACRDKAKGEAGEDAIRDLKSTRKEVYFLQLNLANLKSVKASGEDFLREPVLHVLFNNAGVMAPPIELLTDDGYDLQFGTNVLGHFYFTKIIMLALLAGAAQSPDGTARIVNTASNAHWFGRLDYDTFKDSSARKQKSAMSLYGQSKMGNILFVAEVARRYGNQGVVSTALNPGGIKTELGRYRDSFYDVSFGALTQLYAETTTEGANLNGKYLVPWPCIGNTRRCAGCIAGFRAMELA
ncbi:NAD(P)-binding protein [Suillus bovinus]|uniref:NAD(P)-binding protein n=1 Tax=Suillus bovinus TaxID=48563 RepID=UPI001B87BA4A|nr:NAD(P)-binding protein [Suillus bovinus]KAG2146149.1 NAD(P)-binding protein [Suillus bovinus]